MVRYYNYSCQYCGRMTTMSSKVYHCLSCGKRLCYGCLQERVLCPSCFQQRDPVVFDQFKTRRKQKNLRLALGILALIATIGLSFWLLFPTGLYFIPIIPMFGLVIYIMVKETFATHHILMESVGKGRQKIVKQIYGSEEDRTVEKTAENKIILPKLQDYKSTTLAPVPTPPVIPGMKICPGCGTELPAEAKFCNKCGTST